MSRPNFKDLAREWLVRVQGHSRQPHEDALEKELSSMYELGAAHAIEVVRHEMGPDGALEPSDDTDELIERIRDATAPKA